MSKKDMNDTWNFIVSEYSHKIEQNAEVKPQKLKVELKTPKQIVKELDKSVIGQEEAKQLVSVAVFNRLLAMNNKLIGRDEEEFFFEKNNIVLIGGTGCGKTHIVRALAKAVGLPVTIQDATTFTSAGYVGRNVEEAIEDLADKAQALVESKYDTDNMLRSKQKEMVTTLASYGIVYIDEADKIRSSPGSGKDVNGRSVQESFLKLVEGCEVYIKSKAHYGNIDTSNMLFIFGGAFADMQKIIEDRTHVKSIGFNSEIKDKPCATNLFQNVSIGDFTKFGMIPELMGRLSTVAILKDLDADMISRIFVEPNRSIMSQIINEFKSYNVRVSFTDDAISYIVDEAMKLKLGARGLKATAQKVLRPLFYYLPSNAINTDIIVTKRMLEELKEQGLS